MAGHFPYAYFNEATTTNDYGGDDSLKNLHYRIHNNNNNSVFSSDGAIDIYKFQESDLDSSAERAYALIVLKNVGASNSLLNCSSITLNSNSSESANFSLVTNINELEVGVDFDGNIGASTILTPAQYASILTPLSGSPLSGPVPMAYLKIGTNSGTVSEADFDGSGDKYIPVYSPDDITNSSYQISANNFGTGTVYSQYATFLLKCDPVAPSKITESTDEESLVIGFNVGEPIKFYLNISSFSEGLLNYQQGKFVLSNNQFTFTPNNENANKPFASVTTAIPTINTSDSYKANLRPGFGTIISAGGSTNVRDTIYLGYLPYGMGRGAETGGSGIQGQENSTIRIYDSLNSSDGVRMQFSVSILNGVTVPKPATPSSYTYHLNYQAGISGDIRYYVYPHKTYDVYEEEFVLDGPDPNRDFESKYNNLTLETVADQNVYIVLDNKQQLTSLNNYYIDSRLGVGTQNLNITGNNWRPLLSYLSIAYNPFYINGLSGESTTIDYMLIAQGQYKVLSTTTQSLTRFMDNVRPDVIQYASTNDTQYYQNIAYQYEKIDIFSGLPIGRHISGNQIAGNGSSVFKGSVRNNTEIKSNVTTLLANLSRHNPTSGEFAVGKHMHVKQFQVLPHLIYNNQSVQNLCINTGNGLALTFNNISGEDKFYAQDFPWVNEGEDPVVTHRYSADQSYEYSPIEITNRDDFRPNGMRDLDGNVISNARTVFAAGSQSGGSFIPYNRDGIPNDAKYKSVLLDLRFKGSILQGGPFGSAGLSFDDHRVDSFGGDGVDALGRVVKSTSVTIKQGIIDIVAGATQTDNGNKVIAQEDTRSNVLGASLTYHVTGYIWPRYYTNSQYRVGALYRQFTSKIESATFYSTRYVPNNNIGGHNISTTRPALSTLTQSDITQSEAISTTDILPSGTESLTHYYASVDSTKDFYYKKYPLCGQFVFKYEKYFGQRRYSNFITQPTASDNFVLNWANTADHEEHGILPGPLVPGRFNSAGDTARLAYKTADMMYSASATYNSSAGTYEAFIEFDYMNSSDYPISLVSIDLDNYVGNPELGSNGFGDPRFVYGQGEILSSTYDGTRNIVYPQYGEVYETAVSDTDDITVKAFSHDLVIKSNVTGTGTTLTLPDVNNIYVGQRVFAHSQNVPVFDSGTTVQSIDASANTVQINNALSTSYSGPVTFDCKHKDYITWGLVKGKRDTSSSAQLNNFVTKSTLDLTVNNLQLVANSNVISGQGVFGATDSLYAQVNGNATDGNGDLIQTKASELIGCLVIGDNIPSGTKVQAVNDNNVVMTQVSNINTSSATFRFVHPDRLTFAEDYFTNIGQGGNDDPLQARVTGADFKLNFTDKAKFTRNDKLKDKYPDASSLTEGAPHIYFSADATKISENDLDTGVFYNILKIKYMFWDKIDMYGVNHSQITGDGGTRFDFTNSNADEAHVFEDTYLVKIDFTNLQPEIGVTDLEGDSFANNSTIDFGTLKTS